MGHGMLWCVGGGKATADPTTAYAAADSAQDDSSNCVANFSDGDKGTGSSFEAMNAVSFMDARGRGRPHDSRSGDRRYMTGPASGMWRKL
jgi:hypothetical protein